MQASGISEADRVESDGWSSRLVEKRLLPWLLSRAGPARLCVIVGNGAPVSRPGVVPRFTIRIRDPRTLLEILFDPEIGFGDAWIEGRVDVSGDLVGFLEAVYGSMATEWRHPNWYMRRFSRWLDTRQANTPEGSRNNICSHYDLGNDFYRLWLDSQLVYTCAYFPSTSLTLEEAQIAKMDHVCRKLRLGPGESVVEAGCGWGALALHMARRYGVRVKAFNISREQIRHARRRARAENLGHLVEFVEDDYRNAKGRFDVFVSVGMLEHVGRDNYGAFGGVVERLIGDRGRGLLHFIGRSEQGEFSRWIRRRIFPGAYAPTLREALRVLEPFGYFVQDVENLRAHYARTLEHWLERFDRSSREIAATHSDEFERAWRLYLAGSIAGFRAGTLQLFQIVFSGAKCEPVPWTRADLYNGESGRRAWTPATS